MMPAMARDHHYFPFVGAEMVAMVVVAILRNNLYFTRDVVVTAVMVTVLRDNYYAIGVVPIVVRLVSFYR